MSIEIPSGRSSGIEWLIRNQGQHPVLGELASTPTKDTVGLHLISYPTSPLLENKMVRSSCNYGEGLDYLHSTSTFPPTSSFHFKTCPFPTLPLPSVSIQCCHSLSEEMVRRRKLMVKMVGLWAVQIICIQFNSPNPLY